MAASASAIARANTALTQTSPVNEVLVRAVTKAVARAAAADTDEMISALREVAGER